MTTVIDLTEERRRIELLNEVLRELYNNNVPPLAQDLHVTRQTIYNWRNGDAPIPGPALSWMEIRMGTFRSIYDKNKNVTGPAAS